MKKMGWETCLAKFGGGRGGGSTADERACFSPELKRKDTMVLIRVKSITTDIASHSHSLAIAIVIAINVSTAVAINSLSYSPFLTLPF